MREAFFKRALKVYLLPGRAAGVLADRDGADRRARRASRRSPTCLVLPRTAVDGARSSGLLLLYNPPLLDILPMYVLFMLLSPVLLLHALAPRLGRDPGRQRAALAGRAVRSEPGRLRGARRASPACRCRSSETGAFEMLGLAVPVGPGLWIGVGARRAAARCSRRRSRSGWCASRWSIALRPLRLAACVGQAPFPQTPQLNLLYDKWHLGPLRLINFLCAACCWRCTTDRARRARLPRVRVLEMLGRQSLPVFCAHLVLAMLTLALFGAIDPERPWSIDARAAGWLLGVLCGARISGSSTAQRPSTAKDGARHARELTGAATVPTDRRAGPGAPRSRASTAHSPPG